MCARCRLLPRTDRSPPARRRHRPGGARRGGGSHRPLLEVPDIPPLLAAAVEAALARDLAARPPTAEYFAATLRAAVSPDSVVLPVDSLSPRVAPAPLPPEPVVVTRSFGPQPVRPLPTAEPSRRRAAVIGALALAAVLVGVGVVTARLRDREGPSVAPSAAAVVEASRRADCPDVDRVPIPAAGRELSADLAGDGCPVQIVWDGSIMRFRLAGDVVARRYDFKLLGARTRSGELVVGDWDCDGTESLPSTTGAPVRCTTSQQCPGQAS